jgi:hypothetical protein
MYSRLTPQAVARTRRWVRLLQTDRAAPVWSPAVSYPTPEPLRVAARWLVDAGHAPGMQHEMVCVLLALYAAEVASDMDGAAGGAFIPRDAA